MEALVLHNMYFNYPNKPIFEAASFSAESGKITGILGGNGAGKTTFFDILCGLKDVQSSSFQCNSEKIMYLSQTISTPGVLTMRDIVKMTISLTPSNDKQLADITETLTTWDSQAAKRYSEFLGKKSSLCSYGEKRWFFTLTLISLRPSIVILDEPTAGVDLENRFYIWRCLKKAAEQGIVVLVSSHDINEIEEHCDTFYMINQRRLSKFETAEQFKAAFCADSLDQAFINAVRL